MNHVLLAVAKEREVATVIRDGLDARDAILDQIEALAVRLDRPTVEAPETAAQGVLDPPTVRPATIDRKLFDLIRLEGPLRPAQLLARPDVPWSRMDVYASLTRLRGEGVLDVAQRTPAGTSYRATPGGALPGPDAYVPSPKAVRMKGADRREKVYDYIVAHPGASPADINTATEVSTSTLRNDLDALRADHRIQRDGNRQHARYWTTEAMDARDAGTAQPRPGLTTSDMETCCANVVLLVREQPGTLTQEAVIAALQEKWAEDQVKAACGRLVALGEVVAARDGTYVLAR